LLHGPHDVRLAPGSHLGVVDSPPTGGSATRARSGEQRMPMRRERPTAGTTADSVRRSARRRADAMVRRAFGRRRRAVVHDDRGRGHGEQPGAAVARRRGVCVRQPDQSPCPGASGTRGWQLRPACARRRRGNRRVTARCAVSRGSYHSEGRPGGCRTRAMASPPATTRPGWAWPAPRWC